MSNSVWDISKECKRMIELCSELVKTRIDVYNSVNVLQKSIEAMNTEFNKDNFDEVELQQLKLVCEYNAINLELLASSFIPEFRSRYLDRIQIHNVFNELRGKVDAIEKNIESVDRTTFNITFMAYSYIAKREKASKHILFTLSDEDKEYIQWLGTSEYQDAVCL